MYEIKYDSVGKIELGIIPHVIDTVVFVKDGRFKMSIRFYFY